MPTHFKGSEAAERALSAYINLIRATDSVFSKSAAQLESSGITVGQFAVMEALHHLGPMCQHTLAKKLLRSGGNITLVVDNLEKRGWVRRERQKKDRRMVEIHLTPKGARLIAKVFPEHAAFVAKIMGELTTAEQEELRRIAGKLGHGAEGFCLERFKREKQNDSSESK
jgi:MarR family transcriptional regulator, 2-MHQ and catechol-resistance regulon repressor